VSSDPSDAQEGDLIFRSDLSPPRFRTYKNSSWADINDSKLTRSDVVSDSTSSGTNIVLTTASTPYLILTNSALVSINEITAATDGQSLTVTNRTGNAIQFNDNLGTTPANRIRTGTDGTISLENNASLSLVYSNLASRWMVIGGVGGTGDASALQERLEIQLADSSFEFMTPNVFTLTKDTLIDTATASTNASNKTYKFTAAGQYILSKQMMDASFIAENRAINSVDLTATWLYGAVDTAATYQVSKDGGATFETVSMSRVGTSGTYRALHYFSSSATPTDLRVKITSSTGSVELLGYGIFYGETQAPVTGVLSKEVVTFSGTSNLNEFTLTKFLPNPDSMRVYEVDTGQVYVSGAWTLNGKKVTFPTNTFNKPGETITLIFDQSTGSGFDYSDTNAALLAANSLGSTDASIDRSSAGRGIMLRSPDGTLYEVTIRNSGAGFDIYQVT
jgi:hypothetical protein